MIPDRLQTFALILQKKSEKTNIKEEKKNEKYLFITKVQTI